MKTWASLVAVIVAMGFNLANAQPQAAEIDGFVLVMNDNSGINYVSKERTVRSGGVIEFDTLTLLKQQISLPGGTAAALNGKQLLDCPRKVTRAVTVAMLSASGEVLSRIETEKVVGVKWEPLKPNTVPFHAAKLHCGTK